MKSPKRSTRGLLPGFRTEASPALHREDVPFDIVGPWIAFHGVDLASRTWHGSALVLVRIEPRAIAEADRRAAEAQAKQDAAQALHNNGGPLQVITTEDAEKDIKLQDLRTKIESLDDSSSSSSSSSSISLPSTPSPVLTPQASSLTLGDSPEPSPPRNPLRRTSSHEIEAFRASRESKRGLGEQAANPASKPGNSAFLAQTVSPIQSTQSTQTLQYPVQIPDTSQSVQTPDQAPDPPQSRMSAKPSLEITITVPASPDTPVHTLTLSDPLVLYAQMFEYSVFRFDLAIPQHPTCTTRIRYKVTIPNPHEYVAPHDELSELEFNIPGVTEKVHAAFFSCSGFEDTNREADQGVGNPGLWHDILRVHRIHPFHLLIGGGDQIYQDDVFDDVASLHRWMYGIPYQREREAHPWTQEMEEASECFYFRNACLHFGTTIVGDAMAVIPHVSPKPAQLVVLILIKKWLTLSFSNF